MKLTEKKVHELHKKHAQNKEIFDRVWDHSQIVKEIAVLICEKLKKNQIKVDTELVKIGALMHDIGVYKYLPNEYVKHGEIGYKILKEEQWGEQIARFSLVHIGVGIGKNIPVTLEEEIVAYADNFHSKGETRLFSHKEQREKLEKFDKENGIILKRFKEKFGVPKFKKTKNENC